MPLAARVQGFPAELFELEVGASPAHATQPAARRSPVHAASTALVDLFWSKGRLQSGWTRCCREIRWRGGLRPDFHFDRQAHEVLVGRHNSSRASHRVGSDSHRAVVSIYRYCTVQRKRRRTHDATQHHVDGRGRAQGPRRHGPVSVWRGVCGAEAPEALSALIAGGWVSANCGGRGMLICAFPSGMWGNRLTIVARLHPFLHERAEGRDRT